MTSFTRGSPNHPASTPNPTQTRYKIDRDALFKLLGEQGLLVSRKQKYVKATDSKGSMHQFSDLVKNLVLVRREQYGRSTARWQTLPI